MKGNKQEIIAGDESTNVQGGNVLVIQQNGLNYDQVRQVAMDIFKNNFYYLGEKASEIAEKRAEEITKKYIEELHKNSLSSLQNTQDPDVRYSLYEIQKSYARHGSMAKAELLVDLLVRRTMTKQHSFETIVLNEALITISKLTLEQMDILSLIFIVRDIYLKTNPPFEFYYETFFNKFLEIIDIPQGRMFYEHLNYSGCITIENNSENLADLIEQFNSQPIFSSFPKLIQLEECWNDSLVSQCTLSTVGIVIAISNLKMRLGIEDLIEPFDYLQN